MLNGPVSGPDRNRTSDNRLNPSAQSKYVERSCYGNRNGPFGFIVQNDNRSSSARSVVWVPWSCIEVRVIRALPLSYLVPKRQDRIRTCDLVLQMDNRTTLRPKAELFVYPGHGLSSGEATSKGLALMGSEDNRNLFGPGYLMSVTFYSSSPELRHWSRCLRRGPAVHDRNFLRPSAFFRTLLSISFDVLLVFFFQPLCYNSPFFTENHIHDASVAPVRIGSAIVVVNFFM